MCEICKKHGKGDKWYLNPKNYSKEMGEARKEFLEKIADSKWFENWLVGGLETLEILNNIPVLNKFTPNLIAKYEQRTHGGQIVALDDALKILELCESPALLPCECKRIVGKEQYCCLNFGLLPKLYKKANPDDSIEEITVNKAKRMLSKWNKRGMYHLLIWSTAPYVTTICNCINAYCTGFKGRVSTGTKTTMMKGEYIAIVSQKLCNGCKICLTRCQFGAMRFNLEDEKAFVDIQTCFGCGVCKTGCSQNAIRLVERKLTPAKNLW